VARNRVASAVVDSVRGQHPEFVFVYRGKAVGTINNTAWQSARRRAGLEHVRVHDLKHTFGRRLRAAAFEDCQHLLGGAHYHPLFGCRVGEVEGNARKIAHTNSVEAKSAHRGRGKRLK